MFVPEINAVKNHLSELTDQGVIAAWELPYENILTRLSAALFFLTPTDEASLSRVAAELEAYSNFSYRLNEEKQLSQLKYRVTFSQEEKEKNLQQAAMAS
jgi:hypothetical protein